MTPPRRTAKPESSTGRDTPLRVVGIDLGTTNSTIAEVRWEPGGSMQVRCVEVDQPTHEGTYTHVLFPSVVAIHGERVWVGEGAKRLRSRAPERELEQNRNLFFECKNDMGVARTYHRAPEGFRSASEIGGRVLAALQAAARADDATPIERVVVTVPASFQAAQRRDTLEAARLAGLSLSGGDLLDEPVAAFLDYVMGKEGGEGRTGARALDFLTSPAVGMTEGLEGTLVVLDFGGGTCDVAVLRLQRDEEGRLAVSPLSVSRYHRLGGGDIDSAIVHEVLIPEMVRENNLGPFDLTFEDKKKVLEPSLLGLAEALKISLCSEVARLERFGKYGETDRETIAAQQPVTVEVRVGERTLKLTRPRLSAAAFEKLLVPFLEHDLLYARETEYRLTCSVFAPLQDALDRSGLSAKDVSSFLMVGGSSLIPQVVREVRPFFPNAKVLTYPDRDSLQTAVARGAALHAAALALTGRGLVQPVANDAIALKAESRSLELVRKGERLPLPAEGAIRKTGLTVPVTSQKLPVDVRVELVAGEGEQERPLFRGRWSVPPPVTKGEGLVLEYSLDANQILELKLSLATRAGTGGFACTVENPLTNVVNPQAARVKLDALEEDIRTGKVAKEEVQGALIDAADLMVELGHRERAFAQLKKVLQSVNRPNAAVLNRMAMICGDLGDRERAAKLFREAAVAGPRWGGPLFNLALLLERHGDSDAAIAAIDEGLKRERDAPYLVLRARIAGNRGDGAARERDLAEALGMFGPPQRLDEWRLGWLLTAAGMAGRKELAEAALAEMRLRKRQPEAGEEGGMLPGVRHLEIVEQ
jgi:molecular chaperone DnaK